MPFLQLNVPTNALPAEKKVEVIEKLTATIRASLGAPTEAIHVHINEVAEGGYASGGQVIA